MSHFDVFNGDADGLCSLHQLRLAEPCDSVPVTGVKRDIALLQQVDLTIASSVTVLDISLDKNRDALVPLLDAAIPVSYFDHHFAGDIPQSTHLNAYIDTDANQCTGLLVNQHLHSAWLVWAIVAAFGDNLLDVARQAAAPLNLSAAQLSQLQTLGTLLNYNGYGSSLDDLYFPPAQLYALLKPYQDPFAFIAEDSAFKVLDQGFIADMQLASATKPLTRGTKTAVYVFPEAAYARRVSGVFANELAQQNPQRAHALLSTLPNNGYLVSVRAPLNNKTGADELCRQFDTGGGRKAAAGINFLPEADLDRFCASLEAQFS